MHIWEEALLDSVVFIIDVYMYRIALLVFASWNNNSITLELNAWSADKLLHKHKEQFDYKQLNNFTIISFILSGRLVYERAIGRFKWLRGIWEHGPLVLLLPFALRIYGKKNWTAVAYENIF